MSKEATMTTRFRKAFAAAIVVAFTATPMPTHAQAETAEPNTIPITTIVAAVAKRSGKKFIVDPRVKGEVALLQSPASMTYDDFLMLLQVHGFAAVTNGEYVRVIPDASVRQMSLPVVNDDKHSPAEYVTKIMPVKSIPAAMLVPMLRPLIPQQSHFVALPCTNDLIIVDTFGNVQRIEKLVRSLDRGEPYTPAKCSTIELARATDTPRERP
jgi:type II secretory pathway component GspD/PulD (secretin)